jgi:hypothetical protein
MDVVQAWIPYGFIRTRARLTWREVLFGLNESLLDPAAPIEIAIECVTAGGSDPMLLELSALSVAQDARPLVEALAGKGQDESLQEIRSTRLCLVLAWIYEHRTEYDDPLQEVEKVYADFDYPEGIAGFVRYMPMDEPDLGTRELNEARLYEKWKRYVHDCSRGAK